MSNRKLLTVTYLGLKCSCHLCLQLLMSLSTENMTYKPSHYPTHIYLILMHDEFPIINQLLLQSRWNLNLHKFLYRYIALLPSMTKLQINIFQALILYNKNNYYYYALPEKKKKFHTSLIPILNY